VAVNRRHSRARRGRHGADHPLYAASTQLFVTTTCSADNSAAAYQGNLFSQQRVTSYSELIEGTQVAQRVVDELGLQSSAAAIASSSAAIASAVSQWSLTP